MNWQVEILSIISNRANGAMAPPPLFVVPVFVASESPIPGLDVLSVGVTPESMLSSLLFEVGLADSSPAVSKARKFDEDGVSH